MPHCSFGKNENQGYGRFDLSSLVHPAVPPHFFTLDLIPTQVISLVGTRGVPTQTDQKEGQYYSIAYQILAKFGL